MKLINQTRRCSSCGCISFPDSRVCHKCGKSHYKSGLIHEPAQIMDSTRLIDAAFDIAGLNQNLVINISDNITISIRERHLIQTSII